MSKQIVITELHEDDKETVRRVLVESYQQYESDYPNLKVWNEYLEDITTSVDNPQVDKILVARSNHDIIGTVQLFLSSENAYERPELEIFSPIIRLLAVHPDARGLGVAQKLLKASIDYAREKGAANLYLHSSDPMHKAIRLYEWFGFKRDQTKEFQSHDIFVKCYRLDL